MEFGARKNPDFRDFPGGPVVDFTLLLQEAWVQSLVRKISWRRKYKLTPVFLPGKSHGQRSLVGYSPRGCKKLDIS